MDIQALIQKLLGGSSGRAAMGEMPPQGPPPNDTGLAVRRGPGGLSVDETAPGNFTGLSATRGPDGSLMVDDVGNNIFGDQGDFVDSVDDGSAAVMGAGGGPTRMEPAMGRREGMGGRPDPTADARRKRLMKGDKGGDIDLSDED